MALDDRDHALVELGRALKASSYEFVTVTPETHRHVLSRDAQPGRDLRDVFGWSRAFDPGVLPTPIRTIGERASVFMKEQSGLFRATVRFSSLGEHLLVHSAFPTLSSDSVFFGPDTYRFCSFLKRCGLPGGRVVDVGCGTGAGGILASQACLLYTSPSPRD